MHERPGSVPVALTIAGSDPSGGAGIQADLKTFAALGVYGASVITALTAQNTRGVTAVHTVPAPFIAAEIEAVASDLDIRATKTGMLGDRATVEGVAAGIRRFRLSPLVVDPVMVATSGDVLIEPEAIDAVRTILLPLASLITPNLHEAARMLDEGVAATETEMMRQAVRLLKLGPKAVLVKGGHGSGDEAVDVLVSAAGETLRLAKPRIATRHTHGTGCTLSAAIAAHLALGASLGAAVARAKEYLWQALLAGRDLGIGQGAGPVDHAFALRKRTGDR
jgi:hydroxymethylpyrimidine/phosphomethylpyrimidine kinase